MLLAFVSLLVLAGFRLAAALTPDDVGTATAGSTKQSSAPITASTPRAGAASTPSKTTSASTTSSAGATSGRSTGDYTSVAGGTDRHGSGTLKSYAVQVETGTGQDARTFADAVDATLGDPASWAGAGRWALKRVTTDDADFVIRLATPATVDEVCATVGLDTRGYVSCRAGNFVMINLDRWLTAVPDYKGDIALYRRYVINHEVGHQLGYGHQACPGPGQLAPVMQQQTFGLDGCLANGSPYVDGLLVSGPATP
jgi:hypothetical protein